MIYDRPRTGCAKLNVRIYMGIEEMRGMKPWRDLADLARSLGQDSSSSKKENNNNS